MAAPKRMSPQEVREHVQAGKALLICAYESDEKFQETALDGAVSFSEYQRRMPSLSPQTEIVFY
jgi:hypothetical protein